MQRSRGCNEAVDAMRPWMQRSRGCDEAVDAMKPVLDEVEASCQGVPVGSLAPPPWPTGATLAAWALAGVLALTSRPARSPRQLREGPSLCTNFEKVRNANYTSCMREFNLRGSGSINKSRERRNLYAIAIYSCRLSLQVVCSPATGVRGEGVEEESAPQTGASSFGPRANHRCEEVGSVGVCVCHSPRVG